LQCKQWHSGYRKYKPDIEVQEKVPDIEVPRFSPIDLRASARSAEYVVHYDVERHKRFIFIKEGRYDKLEKLYPLESKLAM
jgi:hypothetical protein